MGVYDKIQCNAMAIVIRIFPNWLSKKEDKDQESIQSSTIPDPGYQ